MVSFNVEAYKQLMKDNKLSQTDLQNSFRKKGIDISIDTIKSWTRKNKPSTPEIPTIVVLAEILNVEPICLLNGLTSKTTFLPENIIMIEKLDIRAGAGAMGCLDVPSENNRIAIDKLIINGLNPKYLKVIEIIGDSMEPEYQEGDLALVDMVYGRNDFTKIGGVYIVRVDDMIYIKKVEFLPRNRIKLISINHQYGEILPHDQGSEYQIIGKVCGKIHVSKGLSFDNQGIE